MPGEESLRLILEDETGEEQEYEARLTAIVSGRPDCLA